MAAKRNGGSHLFVVFGATGDLARRKLLPAIYRFETEAGSEAGWRVLGVARSTEYDDASYRVWAREALGEWLAGNLLDRRHARGSSLRLEIWLATPECVRLPVPSTQQAC